MKAYNSHGMGNDVTLLWRLLRKEQRYRCNALVTPTHGYEGLQLSWHGQRCNATLATSPQGKTMVLESLSVTPTQGDEEKKRCFNARTNREVKAALAFSNTRRKSAPWATKRSSNVVLSNAVENHLPFNAPENLRDLLKNASERGQL